MLAERGFNLQQLTDILAQGMMPYLQRTSDGVLVRLDVHYTRVMKVLGVGVNEYGERLIPSQKQQKFLKELFGETVVDAAPPSYYEGEAFLAAEKMPHEWAAIPIQSRAKWMAARRIQGMVKTLERYRETMDRRRKQAMSNRTSSRAKKR